MIPWLALDEPFPPVEVALDEPSGLLAGGADLTVERLIDAYRHGIFPWFNEDQPILWWSTDPRMVLYTQDFRISHSLRKKIRVTDRDAHWEIRCDSAFETVIRSCAAARAQTGGTWIGESMIAAYLALHAAGVAHSVETWHDDVLVGGLYGINLGQMFYGESMFARETDASKLALAYLVAFLRQQQCPMIDCQQDTAHLASLGAAPITRERFVKELEALIDQPALTWPQTLSYSRLTAEQSGAPRT